MARRRLAPARTGDFAAPAPAGRPEPEAAPFAFPAVPPPSSAAPVARMVAEAAAEAALRDLGTAFEAARAEGRLALALPLASIDAGHMARDRLPGGDPEAEAALEASLRAHGQRVPVEVTPLQGGPCPWGLISGWRRLSALRRLHAATGEDRFATVKAVIRPAGEAAGAYVAMVEENEIRAALSHYERARIVAVTTALGVFASEQEALRRLFASASRARRSKIGSFLALHHELGACLRFPAAIPERLGLRLSAALQAGAGTALRTALAEGAPPATPAAEAAILTRTLAGLRNVSRAKRNRNPDGRQGGDEIEVAPGLRLAFAVMAGEGAGAGAARLVLSGPAVTPALAERLRRFLAAGNGHEKDRTA
jgi:hypothetical protein